MDAPGGEVLRMNPPIRERFHQEPLFEALRGGLIDMLATDHAPHEPREKYGERIWDLACGFPGLESSLPLMMNAVNEGRFDLNRYVQVSSANPARAWGSMAARASSHLAPMPISSRRHGPGRDADRPPVSPRAARSRPMKARQ